MIEILHRDTGAVVYRSEQAGSLREAVVEAVDARANLAGANLARADLAGADLAGATAVIDAGTPHGWRAVGWRRNDIIRVRVGCRDKTMAEAREYWRGKDDRREVMAALDYIEAVALVRGWVTNYDNKERQA